MKMYTADNTVKVLPGIGNLTQERLNAQGIYTLGDLLRHLNGVTAPDLEHKLKTWFANPRAGQVLRDGSICNPVNRGAFNTVIRLLECIKSEPKYAAALGNMDAVLPSLPAPIP